MQTALYHRPRSNDGNTLLMVMGTVLVLGIALASVLRLTMQEHRVLARTSAWNAALPAAEAGIEEAMSHLRQVDGGNRAVNGWAGAGTNFILARNLGQSQFAVAISSASPPLITSIGYVWCPSAGKNIERRVQVTTKGQGLFMKGLTAKDWIKMSGQVATDSFDSTDPLYSTNGLYIASRRKDKGDVASNRNSSGAMDFSGQVKIYGSIATGPLGTVSSSGVAVGTTAWINAGNTGIQTNRYTKDMNVSFPSATAPYASRSLPGSAVVGGVTYKYLLQDGLDYRLSTLVLSGSDKLLVQGKARLLVDKNISISGNAFIQMATNANLQLYVEEGSVSISGGGVANLSGKAANLSLFGLPQVADIKFSGGGSFLGTIYAPQAKLSMSGGGSDVMDFTGAAIVNQVDANGQYKFHYDEALGNNSSKNLVVASWKEL